MANIKKPTPIHSENPNGVSGQLDNAYPMFSHENFR